MRIIHGLALGFFLVLCLTACVTNSAKEKPRVHCPACDSEFDALIHQRF
jgi:hypothetical protein